MFRAGLGRKFKNTYNDEVEEEDNSPRIVLGEYITEEMQKIVNDWFFNNN
jgi:hypothetical protein